MRMHTGLLTSVGLLCLGVSLVADDAVTPPAGTNPAAQAAVDVGLLIPQLDHAEFSQRQSASQKLMEAGKSVFPQLEKTALEGSREASGRAIDILKTHFNNGDDDTKQSAKAALERLAKSGSAGAAQRASEALNPPQPPELPINGPFGMVPNFRRGNIQIQVGAPVINNVNRRVSIREANGRREIEHVENGKTTKIVKNPNGSIEAETTEKQNGKDVTKKVEAKDLDDLKKKDPDAAKIFEQYNVNGAGNIQILPGFPGFPAILPDRPGVPNLPADIAEERLKSLDRQIERIKAQAPNNPGAARLLEIFEEQKKQLEKSRAPAPEKPAEPKAPEAPAPAAKPAQ